MDTIIVDIDIAWQAYVDKHKGTRGYTHFDAKCDISDQKIQEYILNPANVKSRSFWPFISYDKATVKVKRNGDKLEFKEKVRPICYSSHVDRYIYQRYAFLINQHYNSFAKDNGLDQVAIAYRDNLHKAPSYFAHKAFMKMEELGHCFVMVADFTGFFDYLDHRYLKKQLCRLLNVQVLPDDYYAVYKSITRYTKCEMNDILDIHGIDTRDEKGREKLKALNLKKVANKEEFEKLRPKLIKNKNSYGVPQGAAISDVFANVYMMDYDLEMNSFAMQHNGCYMRYSDDTILILPMDNETNVESFISAINEILGKYKGLVTLEMEKTKQYEYTSGNIKPLGSNKSKFIDYLGLRLNSHGIGLRPRCLTKYYYRLKRKARGIKRWQKNLNKKGMISYNEIYQVYGEKRRQGNFMSYVEMVNRTVGLENDPEANALLNGGAKKKIRQELTRA